MGVLRLGSMTMRGLFTKAPTRKYPYEKREPFARTRGHVEMADIKECIFCGACQKKCPADAIEVKRQDEIWSINPYKCIACASCVRSCPKSCLIMDSHYPAVTTKPEWVLIKRPERTPEEIAELERKEAEKRAKIAAAKKAKEEREAAAAAATKGDREE